MMIFGGIHQLGCGRVGPRRWIISSITTGLLWSKLFWYKSLVRSGKSIHCHLQPAIGPRPVEVVLLEAREKVSGLKRLGDRSGRVFGFAASQRASPFHDWNSEKYDFTVVLLQKKRQSAAGSASLTNQLNYISAP